MRSRGRAKGEMKEMTEREERGDKKKISRWRRGKKEKKK